MTNDIASDNAIVVQDLTKAYPGFTLNKVSFTVPRGQIVGCIGENGAGKTTTISLMLGLLRPDAGSIRLLGLDMAHHEQELKSKVAAVPDECPFPIQLTARDIGKIYRSIYAAWDESRYQQLLHDFRLPDNKRIEELSRGMKAKLALATAVCQNPELLILDEATTGLDVGARDDMEALLLDFI
jgi:ABC-2 type transport system ATP-binding protein